MGADNLMQLPEWHDWANIVRTVPMLVVPRPGQTRRALAGQAAKRLQHHRLPARAGIILPLTPAPAWILLPVRENPLSATALRALIPAEGGLPSPARLPA
jgi:nicotinate-nucleotide adenylyltransferase